MKTCKLRKLFLICSVLLMGSFGCLAQNETFNTGSFIINMGATNPGTMANSIKPYGLIYDLIRNYNVPVKMIINPSKSKDGVDFIYNAVQYKGGTFIIKAEYRSAAVNNRITFWTGQGVVGATTTSAVTLNVTRTLDTYPRWTLDAANGDIAEEFLLNAGITNIAFPGAFNWKLPSQLNGCDDYFVMPHADPTWAIHGALWSWNKDYLGSIWSGCHAVSVLENLSNPANPAQKMNFLTTTGLVPFGSHNDGTPPYTHQLVTDPIAQYMGKTDGAMTNGSEQIYLPKLGGAWNAGAKLIAFDPTQSDIPTRSPGAAAAIVYGRGMNDTTRGFVMYEAGHDLNKGSADDAAAQRVFFNFSFFNTIIKRPVITITGITEGLQIQSGVTIVGLNVVATSPVMGTTFTYQWTSSCGGSFSNPTGATTNYTAPTVIDNTPCIITCKITDNCGRTVFNSFGILIIGNHPPTVVNDAQSLDPGCGNVSLTYNVLANDIDLDGQAIALTNVTNPANGVMSFNANGNITYTPNAGFVGIETLSYTVCDNTTPVPLCTAGTFTITVGNLANVPNGINDAFTIVEDVESRLNVLANDLPLVAGPLTVSAITVVPANGRVSINTDNTITYLPNADFTGTDNFTYRVANSLGYSKTATVTVTVSNNFCDGGTYETGTTTTNVTLTATEDGNIYNNNATDELKNYGSCNILYLNGPATRAKDRALIRYDLSSIPATATITSATVRLVKIGGPASARNVSIHRLTNNWTEGTGGCGGTAGVANWQQRITGTPWTTAGGDFDATATATVSVAINGIYNFTATSLVQGWVNSTFANHGILARFTTENLNSLINFASTENVTVANRPQLLVSYTLPVCAAIPTRGPQAMPDTVSTPNGVAVNIATAANDYYPVAGARVYSIITTPASGITSINVTTGVITYTPNTTFNGVRSMVYRVLHTASGIADTAYAYVNITNGAIVANNDYPAGALSGVAQTIDVKANDTDPETASLGASYTVTILTPPTNGTSTVNGSGSVVYTPNAGFTGNDTLFYSITEPSPVCGSPLRDTAMLVIVVLNRPPFPVDDNTSGPPCNAITLNLVANDSDPEGNTLTVTNLSALNPPGAGTLINNNDGTVTYTPAVGFIGVVTFTYRLTDNGVPPQLSAQATVTITILAPPVNNPPVALNDNDTISMDEPLYKNVRNNDYDPDLNELTIPVITVAPLHGTASVNPLNGLIEYIPNPGYFGNDILTYQICDIFSTNPATCAPGIGSCTTATLTIDIIIPNSTYAVNDENSTWINTAVSGVTIINDFDLERDAIVFGGFIDNTGSARVSGSITVSGFAANGSPVANAGTLAIQATGAYNYIPTTGFTGYMSVPYIIFDNKANTATDTGYLAITVSPLLTVANSLIPNNDEDITYGPTISRNLLQNDREVQNYTYLITGFIYDSNGDGIPELSGSLGTPLNIGGLTATDKSVSNAGSFVLNANGNYTFTPAADFHGSVTANYTICGNNNNPYCATSQLQIKILPNGNGAANDPPFGGDDFELTYRNLDKSGNFFNNDREPNGNPISFQGVTINPAGPKNLIQTRTTLRGGTVNFYSDGTYLYTPLLNYIGPDLVTYSLCDVTATAPQPICAGVSLHMLVAEVGSVLPVTLIDFNGKLNGDKVGLYWVTTNEVNARNFVVERSTDGINFIPIATVIARGTMSHVESYTLVDPVPAKGANYYRLKITDKGGAYTYSKIIIIRIASGNVKLITQIRPNPFTSYVDMYISLTKTMPVDFRIFDVGGKLVFQKTVKGNKGFNWFTLHDLDKLPGGMYLLKIVTDTDTIVEKLVK